MRISFSPSGTGKSALVVAHPGHELRVHGWLERARPTTFVLTDGSGAHGHSRLESTRRILRAAGADEGTIFGRMPDRRVYEAVLRHESEVFTTLVDELVDAFMAFDVDTVVSDAREEYNSTHDICRAIVDAAVMIASDRAGRPLASFDFRLVGAPDACPETARDGAIRVDLDERALERKLAAARGYPELADEVDAALQRFGSEAFRVEWLRPVDRTFQCRCDVNGIPFYERYGEQQVAAGVYTEVLRAHDHVEPLVLALQRHARERITCNPSPSC